MKSTTIILFSLLCLSLNLMAYDLPNDCVESNESRSKDCISCTSDTAKKSLPKMLSTLAHLSFLENKIPKLSQANEVLKKSLAPLFRSLRDGATEPSYKTSMIEIKEIQTDYDRLTILSKEAISLQKKFDICITRCSAYRKLEISDELAAIQKIKTSLFIKQPILVNKVFEERMSNVEVDDKIFPREIFEKDLKAALFDNLGKIDARGTEYFKFENDGNKPFNRANNVTYINEYLSNLSSRFPGVMEDLVKSSAYDGSFKSVDSSSACFHASQFKKYSDRKAYIDMSVDAGLFLLPLMAGPMGRMGSLGLELAFGERLALWGLKSLDAKKAMTTTNMIFQAGIVSKDLEHLKNLSEACHKNEIEFLEKSDQNKLKEFRECQKNLGEQIFISELGLIAVGASNIGPAAIKFLSKGRELAKLPMSQVTQVGNPKEIAEYIQKNGLDNLKKGQVSMEFQTADSGVYSIMDLNSVVKSENAAVKNIPEDYWRYVGSIYSERLNLTKVEIEGFIKSSVEMSPRTKLVLNTEKSPLTGKMKINGGVGMVHAKAADDLLPLEKATGKRIERAPNEKIAEIVRLTVGKDVEAEKVSTALISQVSSLIVHDKEISRVFIFTSKAHSRLYKRMGVPTDKIKEIDKRDVIIEFTRSDLERVIEAQKKLKDKTVNYLPERFTISSMMANIWSVGSTPSILTPFTR